MFLPITFVCNGAYFTAAAGMLRFFLLIVAIRGGLVDIGEYAAHRSVRFRPCNASLLGYESGNLLKQEKRVCH